MQMMKVFVLMTGLTVLLVLAGNYLGGPDAVSYTHLTLPTKA